MGDEENAFPSSKKRAAGRQLSRDNPGLDDEEEVSEQETGTFKRASEEVLANRKIVKVRRRQTPSAPSAPSSNPFAAIRLVPPTDVSAAPAVVSTVTESRKTAPEEVEPKETEKGTVENDEKPASKVVAESATSKEENVVVDEVWKPESADAKVAEDKETKKEAEAAEDKEIKIEVKEDTESGIADKEGKRQNRDEDVQKSTEAASVSSFQQLSSSQNAFTGLIGTGFSSSTFSFGSIPKSDQPSLGFGLSNNGNSSLFGMPGVPVVDKSEKIPPMQEVPVETGEENEKSVFTADSVMFEYLDGGWKERGKGELKVNVSTIGTGKARLVMRAKGNYRLILNASLFSDMKLTNMEKRGITFACVNSNGEGKDSLSTFALKFKDASVVEEFCAAVTAHKGKSDGGALKTPENSPKESDE